MNLKLFFFFAFLTLFSLAGCVNNEVPEPEKYIFEGTVREYGTNLPLQDVTVNLSLNDNVLIPKDSINNGYVFNGVKYQITTDKNGDYYFEIETDKTSFSLGVEKDGYVQKKDDYQFLPPLGMITLLNQYDFEMGKGAYLNVIIKDIDQISQDSVYVHVTGDVNILDQYWQKFSFAYFDQAGASDTSLLCETIFAETPSLEVEWNIHNNDQIKDSGLKKIELEEGVIKEYTIEY